MRFDENLGTDPYLLDGDRALTMEEFGIRKQTARHQGDLVLIWYRLFSLLRRGIAYSSAQRDDAGTDLDLVEQLWIHILSYAVGSARQAFGAAVSGYYAQSYTMTRSVFETFLVWQFTSKYPDHAKRWFIGANGEPANPWRTPRIIDKLEKGDDDLIHAVIRTYDRIKPMAHPSETSLQQSVTFDEGVFQIGPNYIPDMCSSTLYEGANAFAFVLRMLEHLGTQTATWSDDLKRVQSDLSGAQEHHDREIKEFRSRMDRGDEWIVRSRS
jgi:hypothetical protein